MWEQREPRGGRRGRQVKGTRGGWEAGCVLEADQQRLLENRRWGVREEKVSNSTFFARIPRRVNSHQLRREAAGRAVLGDNIDFVTGEFLQNTLITFSRIFFFA